MNNFTDDYYTRENITFDNNKTIRTMDTETRTIKRRRRHVGENIRQIRKTMGMNQKDLAEKIQVSHQTLSQIENSEEVSPEQLDQVAKALGVPVELILEYDHEDTINYIISGNTFNNGNSDTASGDNKLELEIEQDDQSTTNIYNPIEKITEIYEKMLKDQMEILEKYRKQVEELMHKK